MDANLFARMQRLGRALMLPIAVLPVAGLLLRLGQPDVFNIKMIADAGDTIFSNLPLLFAIAWRLVLRRTITVRPVWQGDRLPDRNRGDEGHQRQAQHGVLSGIAAGCMAGFLYNKYKDIKLPEYLAFSEGNASCDCHGGGLSGDGDCVWLYLDAGSAAIDAAGGWSRCGRHRRVRVRPC